MNPHHPAESLNKFLKINASQVPTNPVPKPSSQESAESSGQDHPPERKFPSPGDKPDKRENQLGGERRKEILQKSDREAPGITASQYQTLREINQRRDHANRS